MKLKNIFYVIINLLFAWINRPRNAGIALVKIGFTSSLIVSFFSRLSCNTQDGCKIVPETFSWPDLVGLCIIAIGLTLILHDRLRGESSPRHRAKSIDLRSLPAATAPKLCDDFSAVIEQAGLHNDLYFESEIYSESGIRSASEFLPVIIDQFNSFNNNFLKKSRGDSLKPFALGAIAHVPFCFALGFLIGNRSKNNYYCWNRDKKEWIDCRSRPDLGSSAKFITHTSTGTSDTEVRAVGISIEISFKSDEAEFMASNFLDACVKVSVDDQSIGNIFSDVEQTRIVSQIREYINNQLLQKFPNLSELHITVMAQASFIMRLGAEFNQNHMPKNFIYHYDSNSAEKYPWNLELTPGLEKIDWNCT